MGKPIKHSNPWQQQPWNSEKQTTKKWESLLGSLLKNLIGSFIWALPTEISQLLWAFQTGLSQQGSSNQVYPTRLPLPGFPKRVPQQGTPIVLSFIYSPRRRRKIKTRRHAEGSEYLGRLEEGCSYRRALQRNHRHFQPTITFVEYEFAVEAGRILKAAWQKTI